MVKNTELINGEIEDISEDVDNIIEDTEAIDERTKSTDRKVWLLIALWIIDKIIIYGMIRYG